MLQAVVGGLFRMFRGRATPLPPGAAQCEADAGLRRGGALQRIDAVLRNGDAVVSETEYGQLRRLAAGAIL